MCIQNQLQRILVKQPRRAHECSTLSRQPALAASPTTYHFQAGCPHLHRASKTATAILDKTSSRTKTKTRDKDPGRYFKAC